MEDGELGVLRAAADQGRARLFDDRYTAADGVEVLRVGGHTPGQSVVVVRTPDGPVLLASDAVSGHRAAAEAQHDALTRLALAGEYRDDNTWEHTQRAVGCRKEAR